MVSLSLICLERTFKKMRITLGKEAQKKCKELWSNFCIALRSVEQTERCDITICEEWCTSTELEVGLESFLEQLDEVNTMLASMEDPAVITRGGWYKDYFALVVEQLHNDYLILINKHSHMIQERYKKEMSSFIRCLVQVRDAFLEYDDAFQECIFDTQPTLD